jgi:hypothetical protein
VGLNKFFSGHGDWMIQNKNNQLFQKMQLPFFGGNLQFKLYALNQDTEQ